MWVRTRRDDPMFVGASVSVGGGTWSRLSSKLPSILGGRGCRAMRSRRCYVHEDGHSVIAGSFGGLVNEVHSLLLEAVGEVVQCVVVLVCLWLSVIGHRVVIVTTSGMCVYTCVCMYVCMYVCTV